MSSSSENTEIRTRFNSLRDPNLPVSWPNESFSTPEEIYARFSIVKGESSQLEIGSTVKTFRHIGLIYVSLFAPPKTGDGLVKIKADEIAAIFNNWCGSTVKCRATTVKDIGIEKVSGYYQVNVVTPFQRDEVM